MTEIDYLPDCHDFKRFFFRPPRNVAAGRFFPLKMAYVRSIFTCDLYVLVVTMINVIV